MSELHTESNSVKYKGLLPEAVDQVNSLRLAPLGHGYLVILPWITCNRQTPHVIPLQS